MLRVVPDKPAIVAELVVHSRRREPPVRGSFSMPQVKLPLLDGEPLVSVGTSMMAMLSPVDLMYSSVVPSELVSLISASKPVAFVSKFSSMADEGFPNAPNPIRPGRRGDEMNAFVGVE